MITRDELSELNQLLRPYKIPIDGLMSALSGRLEIDIIKLDEMFKRDYDYEWIGPSSMADFVGAVFGDRALELLNKATAVND